MTRGVHSTHDIPLSSEMSQDRLGRSIAQLLREQYPNLRLRERVRDHPLLEQVTLGALLGDPLRLDAFMDEFRSLPQCGTTQVSRLRKVLVKELKTAETAALPRRQSLPLAVMPAAPSSMPAAVQPQPTECTFYPDFVDAVEDVYFRMWRLAQFDSFVYIPSTLPDFAKTPEVLAVELEPGRDLTAYLQRLAALRKALESVGAAEGLILLDGQKLEAFFSRRGRYGVLSKKDVEQQARMLQETLAKLPAGVICRVCDFEVSGLSSGAFVGSKAVLSVMGGYAVFDDAPLVASVQPRIKAAQTHGRPLSDFLDQLR